MVLAQPRFQDFSSPRVGPTLGEEKPWEGAWVLVLVLGMAVAVVVVVVVVVTVVVVVIVVMVLAVVVVVISSDLVGFTCSNSQRKTHQTRSNSPFSAAEMTIHNN